jgi:hypothetical protein
MTPKRIDQLWSKRKGLELVAHLVQTDAILLKQPGFYFRDMKVAAQVAVGPPFSGFRQNTPVT